MAYMRADDRPDRYWREPEPSYRALWLGLLLVLVLAGAAGYYYWKRGEPERPAPMAVQPPVEVPASEPEKPAIRHPVPAAEVEPEKPLPALDESDALMRELLAGLVGRKAFESFVNPAQLVRRIVATVDNLPRRIVPVRTSAVPRLPGAFTPGAANRARYASRVKAFESLDARALVKTYVKLYPLFQRAYVELGHPDGYFNDRLVEAIDDMLAAPELASAPELVQPKVLYLYADPSLEGRSAGQKILMRLGGENAARVKAKLREIRRELASAETAREG